MQSIQVGLTLLLNWLYVLMLPDTLTTQWWKHNSLNCKFIDRYARITTTRQVY